MIVVWPDMPAGTGALKVPQPSVYLFGSHGAADWRAEVARKIEPVAGCVFYSPGLRDGADLRELHSYIQWNMHWIRSCQVLGCWMDSRGRDWDVFELGLMLGLRRPPIWGTNGATGDHMALIFATLGFDAYYHKTLDAFVDGMRASLTEARGQ